MSHNEFIDALHLKVKDGGFIQFNDYVLYSIFESIHYGVVPAVNEFVVSGNHQAVFLCLHPHGYYDLVVKIKKA